MTKQYNNENSGIVFVQTEKRTDKSPDYSGSINVAGVDYWVSGWKKFTQKGEGVSLVVKPKEAKQEQKPAQSYSQSDDPFGDSEIPF